MAEYDPGFAAKLAAVADQVDEADPWAVDARRVTLYLSRLSIEITLKSLLERAGMPLSRIRARSHDLRGLLKDLGECQVEVEIAPGVKQWVAASRARAVAIDLGAVHVPIGELIDAEDQGASKYPNQIRYGDHVVDFPPGLLSAAAQRLAEWARINCETIRFPSQ